MLVLTDTILLRHTTYHGSKCDPINPMTAQLPTTLVHTKNVKRLGSVRFTALPPALLTMSLRYSIKFDFLPFEHAVPPEDVYQFLSTPDGGPTHLRDSFSKVPKHHTISLRSTQAYIFHNSLAPIILPQPLLGQTAMTAYGFCTPGY